MRLHKKCNSSCTNPELIGSCSPQQLLSSSRRGARRVTLSRTPLVPCALHRSDRRSSSRAKMMMGSPMDSLRAWDAFGLRTLLSVH